MKAELGVLCAAAVLAAAQAAAADLIITNARVVTGDPWKSLAQAVAGTA